MSFSILGTGSALPETVITNDELTTFLDTSDEWISSRTGILRRHVLKEESLSDLAFAAAHRALEDSGVKPEELDLIICTTLQGDYISPSQACILQMQLGATCPAFDINAACTGFIYALDIAAGYYARKKVKKVLIVSAEAMTKMVDWEDRSTCILFGDGAGAVVLGEGDDLLSIEVTTKGNIDILYIGGTEGNSPYQSQKGLGSILHMQGQEVFKFAVTSIVRDLKKVTVDAGITLDDLDQVILHQANMRILDSAASRLKIPMEKLACTIDDTGNMSSASIPVALDQIKRDRKLVNGRYIALAGFGAGLTTGACVLRWNNK